MSRRPGTAPSPPAHGPPGGPMHSSRDGPAPRWGLWHRARAFAPTAIVAGAFIGIACWNVVGDEREPTSAVATVGLAGPRTTQVEFQDHPERASHAETLRALQNRRDADRAFVLAIEETLKETRVAPRAAAREAKHLSDSTEVKAAAERQAALPEATRRTAASSEAERQAAARQADRQAEEAIRQAAAEEAKRHADEGVKQEAAQEAAREAKRHADEAVRQAAAQEARRHAVEAAATPVPPSPSASVPVDEQALSPTASEPEGAPGLLVKVRSGETLQTLYLRVYRGLVPPPFESVAALNPERIRPGDIVIFPTPVNGWAERNDADAVSSIR